MSRRRLAAVSAAVVLGTAAALAAGGVLGYGLLVAVLFA